MAGISPGDPPGHRPPGQRRRRDVIAAAAALAVVLAVAVAGVVRVPRTSKRRRECGSWLRRLPRPGTAPGAVYVSPAENDVLTAADRTVWVKNVDNGSLRRLSNGRLVSAPSAIYNGSTVIVFGEGADHELWWTHRLASGGYADWALLGGALTAQPGAVFTGGPAFPSRYEVFVRGADGAVYRLVHGAAGPPSSVLAADCWLALGPRPPMPRWPRQIPKPPGCLSPAPAARCRSRCSALSDFLQSAGRPPPARR